MQHTAQVGLHIFVIFDKFCVCALTSVKLYDISNIPIMGVVPYCSVNDIQYFDNKGIKIDSVKSAGSVFLYPFYFRYKITACLKRN